VPKITAHDRGFMTTEEREKFMQTLRELTNQIENLWIEKEAYLELLTLTCFATAKDLKAEVDRRLDDPVIQKQVRQQFSAMRESLEKSGMSAWFEELSNQLPPNGKPN